MQSGNIPIFMAADDNYAHLILTSVLSIADYTEAACDLYILDGGISKKKKSIIEKQLGEISNISFSFISMEDEVRRYGFLTTGHITMPAYYRFFIADNFPQLDRAIYLDVDVIFRFDIKDLYNLDLGAYVIAAAPEQTSERDLFVLRKNMNLADDSVYLNDGVLLINLARWREQQITPMLLETEKKYHGRLILNDEDIMNVCFEKNYLLLGTEFNAIEKYDRPCLIRHYAGFPKPWELRPDLCIGEFSEHALFWDYLRRTEFYEEILADCKYCNEAQVRKMSMMKKIMLKRKVVE